MSKNKLLTDAVLLHTYDVYIHKGGSVRATAAALKTSRSTVRRRLVAVKERLGLEWDRPVVGGSIQGLQKEKRKLPTKGKIKTYILTCAQNNTRVHPGFWENLKAYAEYREAEILVSQFSYNKNSYAGMTNVKPNTGPTVDDMSGQWFDDTLEEYFCNARVELAPELMFCGEVNIIPTAARPLSGFETYTREASGIFPHTTIALDSIAGHVPGQTKINYSTGTVTILNYIQRKAGLKAEHHHSFGASVVEVDSAGDFWVRQINAEGTGAFYDLDVYVDEGEVSSGHRVEGISWGDVHVEAADMDITELNWGKGGILDTLRPKYQFMHDTVDFHARNHHRIKNPHAMFERWRQEADNVENEMIRVVDFLVKTSHRDWCETIIIDSNHDNALERWLREACYKDDPENAIFFLESQLKKYKSIADEVENYHLIEDVLKSLGVSDDVRFLKEGESFLLCGEIEAGMHGHLGPNGARGGPVSFARMGRKTNTGHSHSAAIVWGAYVGGTSSLLKLEYTGGPSSWSHTHIITYPNAKRCLITARNNLWRGLPTLKK